MINRTVLSGLAAAAVLAFATSAQQTEDEAALKGDPRPTPAAPITPKMKTGTPNAWFERTKLYMGEFLNKEDVKGKFPFRNPTDKAIEWRNLNGSCQCVRAVIRAGNDTWELTKDPRPNSLHKIENEGGKQVRRQVRFIKIPAGAKGEIEVHMEMNGIQGIKEASLSLESTHTEMKSATLVWQAKGVKLFQITPNDVFLNNLTWKDQRKFRFVVESAVNPDFKLLDHDPLPKYVKVTKKLITRPNGQKAWQIDGTFGPNGDPKAGGATIKFKTDWDGKEVILPIIATVQPPVEIKPGSFLSLGIVRKGKGATRELRFIPNDKFDLKLVKASFPKLTFDKTYISVDSAKSKDGKELVVTIKLSPEVTGAYLLRGSIELELNHPSMKSKIINFNGILR